MNETYINNRFEIIKTTKLSTKCMICDESTPLTDYEESLIYSGSHLNPKICDKCKKAILYIRSQMPEE